MLAAKVMTAPNSPSPAANATTAPARMPGAISGSVTVRKRSSGPAPSVRAAASSPGSTPSSDRRMARTISGKDMTAVASAAPAVVNTSRTPNQSVQQRPQRAAHAEQQQQPPADHHGRQHQRQVDQRIQQRPAREAPARRAHSAARTASGSPNPTLTAATRRLSRTASHSSGASHPDRVTPRRSWRTEKPSLR